MWSNDVANEVTRMTWQVPTCGVLAELSSVYSRYKESDRKLDLRLILRKRRKSRITSLYCENCS